MQISCLTRHLNIPTHSHGLGWFISGEGGKEKAVKGEGGRVTGVKGVGGKGVEGGAGDLLIPWVTS